MKTMTNTIPPVTSKLISTAKIRNLAFRRDTALT